MCHSLGKLLGCAYNICSYGQISISCTSPRRSPCPPSRVELYTPSFIMWLMVSSLSPHNLHLLFCCVLSILALIGLVLMAFFCVGIRRDHVSFLKFPFLSHVHFFSCEMLFISRLKRPKDLFFFPFLFPSYCHSFGQRVVCLVSDGCNQSSIMFFFVVLESLYRCISAVFNVS